MPGIQYDVVGIGNALVDVIAHADDGFIGKHDLVKGSMTLVDTDGRCTCTKRGWRHRDEWRLGGQHDVRRRLFGVGSYIGKVSDDELGRVFGHDCRAVGSIRSGAPADGTPTGRCIIVVTPDAQRTEHVSRGVVVARSQ